MAKAILICGKICSGKTTYAEKLRHECHAVLLSCDEITLALFAQQLGDQHESIVRKTKNYLFQKSLEILGCDINVILDWGFWMKQDRDEARAFYRNHGFACEFHYVDVSDKIWQKNLEKRNRAVLDGKVSAYYVDEGLARKFDSIFEMPDKEEMDLWLQNEWE